MTKHLASPVRGRANAAFFRLVDSYVHHLLGERKTALFTDLPNASCARRGSGCSRGCDLCRSTDDLVTAAGFHEVRLERYRLRSVFWPGNEQVAGVAVMAG